MHVYKNIAKAPNQIKKKAQSTNLEELQDAGIGYRPEDDGESVLDMESESDLGLVNTLSQ